MTRCIAILSVLLLLAVALPTSASVFVALTPDELVAGSKAIVVGQVTAVESFWNAEGTLIITEATVAVDEYVLGDAPPTLTIQAHGGQVGDEVVMAMGAPTFKVDERLLVFLSARDDGTFKVTGYRQGSYRIVTTENGVEMAVPTVNDPYNGTYLVKRNGDNAPRPSALPLRDLIEIINITAKRLEVAE